MILPVFIRLFFGRLILKRRVKRFQRKVEVINISKASRIGILYDATNKSNHESVMKFIHSLKDQGKKVESIGFQQVKKKDQLLKSLKEYQVFSKYQLKWTMIPQEEVMDHFISTEFDILIDLNLEEVFPIEYICRLSKAKFKVGTVGGYHDESCDFLIDVKLNKTVDYCIEQIVHYLTIINK